MAPDQLTIDPAHWQANRRLRACGAAARGMFIELLVLMQQGDPYGHLAVDGRALTDHEVASFAELRLGEVRTLMAELDAAGVLHRDSRGRLYSRRMLALAKGRGSDGLGRR